MYLQTWRVIYVCTDNHADTWVCLQTGMQGFIHVYIHITYIFLPRDLCNFRLKEFSKFSDLHISSMSRSQNFHTSGNIEIWKYRNSTNMVIITSLIDNYFSLFSILLEFILYFSFVP